MKRVRVALWVTRETNDPHPAHLQFYHVACCLIHSLSRDGTVGIGRKESPFRVEMGIVEKITVIPG